MWLIKDLKKQLRICISKQQRLYNLKPWKLKERHFNLLMDNDRKLHIMYLLRSTFGTEGHTKLCFRDKTSFKPFIFCNKWANEVLPSHHLIKQWWKMLFPEITTSWFHIRTITKFRASSHGSIITNSQALIDYWWCRVSDQPWTRKLEVSVVKCQCNGRTSSNAPANEPIIIFNAMIIQFRIQLWQKS